MKKLTKLLNEQTELRAKLQELSKADEPTDEQRSEMDTLETRFRALDVEIRAARIADDEEQRQLAEEFRQGAVDPELRERLELRSKVRLTSYLQAAIAGRRADGAELELAQAAGVSDTEIPLELWEPSEVRAAGIEHRADAATSAPGTVGVNLDPIRPAVFAQSMAASMGIEMPNVSSGTYATATINRSLTASAKGKGDDADSTAAGFSLGTATPKRISARMSVRIEDVAAIGAENFEAALRQNLAFVLSDELDRQAINGDGTGDNLAGMLSRLTTPTTPIGGAAIADFDAFVGAFIDGIDGLWAATAKDVSILAGVDTFKLSARTFRDVAGTDLGSVAFSDYAMEKYGRWWTNKRMPAQASNVQAGILYRQGRSAMGASMGMRTAVCPHWNMVSIDDIYTGSARGERYLTLHVLLGDVILVQPDVYAQVNFRLGT